MKITICIIAILLMSGCSFAIYGRIGDQQTRGVKIEIDSQEADPNLPESLAVEAARLLLSKSKGKIMTESLKEPDMSDFENRPSGDYVDHSPNTYKEQYDIRTRQSERAKINEIVEWINKQEQTNEES